MSDSVRSTVVKVRAQVKHPRDVLLAARMTAWAVTLRALKHVVPLPVLVRIVRRNPIERTRDHGRERQVVLFARWTCRFAAWGRRGECLERGLVVYRYLSRLGANPFLVVGVSKAPSANVKGHAWVVVDGEPVDDSAESLSGFEQIVTFGPDGRTPAASY